MVSAVAGTTNCLVLVERYLGGREFCIAVMGAGAKGAVAFSAVERVLAPDEQVGLTATVLPTGNTVFTAAVTACPSNWYHTMMVLQPERWTITGRLVLGFGKLGR